MFFDTGGADDTYRKLLIQAAKTQRELLDKNFCWKERLVLWAQAKNRSRTGTA